MAFARPQLVDLIARIQADVQSRFPGTEPSLRNSLAGILARMEAGAAHELYGALAWLAVNLLPDTKDPDILAVWATIYNVLQLQAVAATGSVTFTGAGTVPAGTAIQSAAGAQYTANTDVVLVAGTGTGVVTAVVAGLAGNLSAGSSVSLVSPVAGINSAATVAAPGLSGGADIEATAAWSARLLQRIQQPPQGGAPSDYEAWARAASPNVTNVWPQRATPRGGQVTVFFMAYGATVTGIPDAGTLALVTNNILANYPADAEVFVLAPAPQIVNLTVQLSPNTVAVQQSVQAQLADLFQREATPGGAIPISHLDEAISEANGEYDHLVVGLTQADLTAATGAILLLGTITWQALP